MASTDGFAGNVVNTDHLLTDSRKVDVIVWKYDDGTVFTDEANEDVASGTNSSPVVQAAVDSGASSYDTPNDLTEAAGISPRDTNRKHTHTDQHARRSTWH